MDLNSSTSTPTPSTAWSQAVETPTVQPPLAAAPSRSGKRVPTAAQESMRLRARLLDLIVARETLRKSHGARA